MVVECRYVFYQLLGPSLFFLQQSQLSSDKAAVGANSCRLTRPPPHNYSGVDVALHPLLLLSTY